MFDIEDEMYEDSFGDCVPEEAYVSTSKEPINLTPIGDAKGVKAMNVVPTALNDSLKKAGETVQKVMDSFEDETPTDKEVEESKQFIQGFTNFIKSDDFKDAINMAAKKSGVPAKKVANSFFGKIAGSVGDILGIAINIVDAGANTLIDLLAAALRGSVTIICKVAQFLTRMVTFNRTNNIMS